jgi:glyoxylase-like metal-dependent hydrolase (beta-lactamase superfamily II)
MKIQTIVGFHDSNTFVVELGGTILIIDAGATIGDVTCVLNGKVPSTILLTHEHYDHVYYLDDYTKKFACPTITPSTEDEITIGNIKIKPILCPGHSPQSVVYLIDDSLFTGDVLFSDTIGRTDLTGGKRPDKASIELRAQNKEQMQASLKRLATIKFKTAYHGHYESSSYDTQQQNIRRHLI